MGIKRKLTKAAEAAPDLEFRMRDLLVFPVRKSAGAV